MEEDNAPALPAAMNMEARIEAFTAVLTNIVAINAQQRARMLNNGVEVAEDLTMMDEQTMLDIFPTTGATTLNAMQKMRLKALRKWAMDQTQELQEDQVLEPQDFTQDVCRKIQMKLAYAKKSERSDSGQKASAGSPGTFNGKADKWSVSNLHIWDKFVANLTFHSFMF